MSNTLDFDALADAIADRVADRLANRSQPHAVGVAEAGRWLGCSESHVRNLLAAGHLRAVPNMGQRRTRIAVAELERFVRGAS